MSALGEALRAIADELESRGLRWFVFGAQAVAVRGAPRATQDLDVTVEIEREQLPVARGWLAFDRFVDRVVRPGGVSRNDKRDRCCQRSRYRVAGARSAHFRGSAGDLESLVCIIVSADNVRWRYAFYGPVRRPGERRVMDRPQQGGRDGESRRVGEVGSRLGP
ncbi:MAG: hypothetical protein SangKO_097390 [Sandaracinaceae bacterium]